MCHWQDIIIDDYIPCFPLGQPIFGKNNGKEIWALLIEKAMAKMFGGYQRLENGNPK